MKRNLVIGSSLALVTIYLIFFFISLHLFQGTFSPLKNWLSDLGNPLLNTEGAFFYNLGICLTGITLLPFFIGLGAWKQAGHKAQNIMLRLTQIFGCLGAFAMTMSAVFPISNPELHSFWSAAIYITIGTAFAFSIAALRYFPKYPRWLLAIGVLVVVENLAWSLVFNTYPMEWVTVFLFLGYILLLGVETKFTTILTAGR